MPLELGSVLNGRYRLRRLLGQGGLGAVYLADDESEGNRPCVVKEYLGLTLEIQRLFRREAGLLANVNHPNLPRVTQHFVWGDGHYLVMDYIQGEALQQRLERDGPLPVAQVLQWAAPLCEAVRYLHSLVPPVLHRDIKPANIILTPEGQLVLVDYGLARPVTDDPRTMALTPGFAPPEQYGMGRVDFRLDQYAVAATLYALLVGQPPPDGLERLADRARLVRPRALRPEVPEKLDGAVARGLEVQPEDRFPDMAAFIQALLGTPPPAASAAETTSAGGRRPPVPAEETPEPRQATPPPPTATPPPAAPKPAAQPITPVTPPPPARPPRPMAAQPTLPVSPPPVAPLPPTARPRSRALLYVVFAFIVIILGAGAIALGSVAGAYLSGRLSTQAATHTPPATSTALTPVTATAPAVVAPTETPVPGDTPPPPTPSATLRVLAETLAPPTETPTLAPTAAGTARGSGGRLAFISNRDGQHFQIFTMNPDGSDVRQLTSDPTDKWDPSWTFGGTQLAWSPDGTRLLYVAASPAGNGTDLFLIDAEGTGEAINLTAAAGDDFHPAWCGNDEVWFTSLRANNTHQIFSTTLEGALGGQRPTNVSGTHNYPREYDPVLLPDGDCQRLMFVTTLQGRPEVWRYFFDCANCYRVVRSERDNNGAAEEPALSADGVYLAYTRRLAASAEIVVGEVSNRLVNVQVTDSGLNYQAQFSPDGQWLVFTSERDGNREIYTMARDGTSQTNLTLNGAIDTDPVWQP